MAATDTLTDHNPTPPSDSPTGDAVGVPAPDPRLQQRWYIAVVNHCGEIRAADGLAREGYESYVASQRVPRARKDGPLLYRDKVVLPSKVFVKCTERQRRVIVNLPYIFRFMTDRAGSRTPTGVTPLAVVSQREIDVLRFMLSQSEIPVEIIEPVYERGDRVEVIRGPLAGLIGDVMKVVGGKGELIVGLDLLGAARMRVASSDLRKL